MISINISPDGSINISIERTDERVTMERVYNEGVDVVERDYDESRFTGDGAEYPTERPHISESDWKDVQTEFQEEHGVPLEIGGLGVPPAAIHLAGAGIAVKADGPGEEDDGTRVNAGTWTMTDDELNSRLEAEFDRGVREGSKGILVSNRGSRKIEPDYTVKEDGAIIENPRGGVKRRLINPDQD